MPTTNSIIAESDVLSRLKGAAHIHRMTNDQGVVGHIIQHAFTHPQPFEAVTYSPVQTSRHSTLHQAQRALRGRLWT